MRELQTSIFYIKYQILKMEYLNSNCVFKEISWKKNL